MKYKLLAVGTEKQVNIGDYVQALASAQFLPSIDGFIEREHLNESCEEETKIIMNGWYMHQPQNWPPAVNITPLFVAMHINSLAKDQLLSEKSIAYLKQHQPIGCRDIYTRDLLQSKGVNAYFSACMTLTLGEKYKSDTKEDKCYFVDPYFHTRWSLKSLIRNIIYLIFNIVPIYKIAKKYPEKKNIFRKMLILTTFYKEYGKLFTEETLVNAEYINQQSEHYKDDFKSNSDRLKEAETLVKKYAQAKLVVTSRIHCALPCLGLETPVIYTEDAHQSEASACRFGGLRELFNIVKWENGHLVSELNIENRLSVGNVVPNKILWIKKLFKFSIYNCLSISAMNAR